MAGELGVVVQIHTGLVNLNKSSPIYLKRLIDECPEVRFDLFHGGFPWMDDSLRSCILQKRMGGYLVGCR